MCAALSYVAFAFTAVLTIFSWRNFLTARQNYQEAEKILVKIRKEKGNGSEES